MSKKDWDKIIQQAFKDGFAKWLNSQKDLDNSTEARCREIEALRQLHHDAVDGIFRPRCETVFVDDAELCGLLWWAIAENWLACLAEDEGRAEDAACHRRKHRSADKEIFSDRFVEEDREVAGEILEYLCQWMEGDDGEDEDDAGQERSNPN